jgi:hypothetical protein
MKSALAILFAATVLLCASTAADKEPAKDSVTISLSGHVKKDGNYSVPKRLPADTSPLIKLAGGFDPMPGYDPTKLTDVIWIERELPKEGVQFIIIDFKNRQILSQRGFGRLLERYDFDTFEFQPDDGAFVTTGRDSLDIAFWRVRGVGPEGWKGLQDLPLVDLTREVPKPKPKATPKPTQ